MEGGVEQIQNRAIQSETEKVEEKEESGEE